MNPDLLLRKKVTGHQPLTNSVAHLAYFLESTSNSAEKSANPDLLLRKKANGHDLLTNSVGPSSLLPLEHL